MSLLALPPEVRGIILGFCFPPAQTYVQIIPYRISLPACQLNLPVALYRVCKLITSELEPLPAKLRRLDFTYIIQGAVLLGSWRPEYGSKLDDDRNHFPFIMRFAERVRLIGAGPNRSRGRGLGSPPRALAPGPDCALKVLEVQPRTWGRRFLARILVGHLGKLTTHPDVAARLEVRLIRDTVDPLEDVEQIKAELRRYQARKEELGSSGPIFVNLTDLDRPEPKDVKDFKHREDKNGPLFADMDDDSS